jgi:AbrB family looped-hinge helix DNA binding protein
MKVRVTLDKAGRVIIPEQMLEELQLAPGDALELESAGEQIKLHPVRVSPPLMQEHGVWVLHTGQPLPASSTHKLLAQMREERDQTNLRKKD